jgi:hypothetical protein
MYRTSEHSNIYASPTQACDTHTLNVYKLLISFFHLANNQRNTRNMNFERLFRYIPGYTPKTGVHFSTFVYILGNKIFPKHHHLSHNADVCLANKITCMRSDLHLTLAPTRQWTVIFTYASAKLEPTLLN